MASAVRRVLARLAGALVLAAPGALVAQSPAPATAATSAAPSATSASAVATAPTAPEPYFAHPDFAGLALSPSGKYIGALAPVRGRLALVVLDIDSRKPTPVARVDGEDIQWFAWVNDERLVFGVVDLQSGLGEQRGGGLFAVNRDGTDFRELSPTLRSLAARGNVRYRYTRFHARLEDGSVDILAVSNDRNERYPDLYRVDTRTGRRTLLSDSRPGDPVSWVADRAGVARGVVTIEKASTKRSWWRRSPDAPWQLIGEYRIGEPGVFPVAFDGDGSMIVAANLGRDTTALYRFDAAKNAPGELLAAHPHVDLADGLVYDSREKRIVGLRYEGAKPGYAWFDENWARIAAGADKALPGRFNELSRGGNRLLVHSSSDVDPGAWHLYDLDARRLEFLVAERKAIRPETMPAREPLRYPARDGLEIPAYLALPPGREAKQLPLVLYVHGGPWVRGATWTWRDEAAFLAAQGYAVLEPEFRGSVGFGRTLFRAGWKQWGRAMQDDLVDGIDFLAKRGTIDPSRVCIMGASYGGYAVMMGLARDPERFRCGVNYVGVSDIALMFDVTWSDMFDSDFIRFSAKELIGDPERDAAQFKATSPLANAAKIRAPVLMAYGAQDYRVPLVHGERMRDALAKQGTPVEWVVYADEGHGFLREANRFDFYGRVAKFLAAHLGDR
jgi:dipeptidyl aminopeptidase/acylaminoacyl peptidase